MSKAIAWAAKRERLQRAYVDCEREEVPNFCRQPTSIGGTRGPDAWVDTDGKLFIENGAGKWDDTGDALKFARWILDTFGEEETR